METDTDADWRRIGETDPFWGVLTEERFRRDRMNDASRRAFYDSGSGDIAFVLDRVRMMVPGFRPREALDFGCGVGRLSLAMARECERVTGLDVSSGMLTEARRAAETLGVGNALFLDALPAAARFDWVNSHIVFQHIPPERGCVILRDLLHRLVPGGVCSIQLTFLRDRKSDGGVAIDRGFWSDSGEDRPGEPPRSDLRPVGTMRMFDYDLNRVCAIMLGEQVALFGAGPTDHGGHHGAWLFGRRAGP